MSKIDPTEAAARAMGDDPSEGNPGGEDVEDVDDAPSSSSGDDDPNLLSRLLDGSVSGPPIAELRSEYDLERSDSFILRGILRIVGSDGMPPIGEISLGGLLKARERHRDTPDNDDGIDL